MERGLVTVVVLSYNRREYLRQTLESALAQTYRNYHVLIVDDASPDGAGDVAREYASQYPGQVTAICKEKRGGAVDSLNRFVFPRSRDSDYVAFLPHDDLWAPEKLERQIECFAADPELGLVCTEANIIDADGRPTGQTFSEIFGTWDDENVTRRLVLDANFICGSSVVVRPDAFASFGFQVPPPIRFLDDHFMWAAISSRHRLQYLEAPLTFYRMSAGNVSNTYSLDLVREDFEVRRLLLERVPGVRRFVSKEEGEDFLRRFALERARYSLNTGRLWQFAWFGGRALQVRPGLRTLSALGAIAREREQGLLAEVAEKDRAVQWLSEQVDEKERAVQWLSEQAAERERAVQWQSEQIAEKDRAVEWLSGQVAERDRAVERLSEQVAAQDRALESLQEQVDRLGQEDRLHVQELAEREEEIQRLREQVAAWERHWSLLQATILWRALTSLRAARKRLAPPGSRREHLWFGLARRERSRDGRPDPADALE